MLNRPISILFSLLILVILFTSCTINKQTKDNTTTITLDSSVQTIPENTSIISLSIFLFALLTTKR